MSTSCWGKVLGVTSSYNWRQETAKETINCNSSKVTRSMGKLSKNESYEPNLYKCIIQREKVCDRLIFVFSLDWYFL